MQGVFSYATELENNCKGKTGMDYVIAKYTALNYTYCWMNRSKWGMVNHHLWRIDALYNGGDCFLAGWKDARPHDGLWSLNHPLKNLFCFKKAHMNQESLKEKARKHHAKKALKKCCRI